MLYKCKTRYAGCLVRKKPAEAAHRTTQSGEKLRRSLKLAQLEKQRREIDELRAQLRELSARISAATVAPVSNEELRLWVAVATPPADLIDVQEERPW